MQNARETIPDNKEGAEVNVEDSVLFADEAEAKRFYATVKSRLLNVNRWKDWAGALSAGFALTDKKGHKIDGVPQTGNYFKIDILAPGITTGEGYDWVRIEEVHEEAESNCEYVVIKVRPAPSPVNADEGVAHFYTGEATSTFIVKRQELKITAGVYGRNEKPNVEAETVVDKIRNAVVGTGAVSLFAKLQWKALVSGLLEKE